MKTLMIKTHEVWLEVMMASFMSKTNNKKVLSDFSDILFRHFTWLENEHIVIDEYYNYDRDHISIKVENLSDLIKDILNRLNEIDLQLIAVKNKALSNRISSDIYYMTSVLMHMKDEKITAFNMERKYKGASLSQEATDALTIFLFEESYKEYELIMIYNYLKMHSKDSYMNRIFQILIDESFFHLKSFGEMQAEMGILGIPRIVMRELYQVENIVQFLKDGINEELAAKEECIKLSEAVAKESSDLEKFFNFINQQENYHIALMEDALKYFTKDIDV
ncbi:MAG: hypothetical protein U9O24_10590 [Campylobacterota bacterium]|nr:hypothetical protein [Campylobacterota bacterium]